jgi:ribonuclease HII
MKTIVGIDEAGRGPVIGPLVMAGVKIKEKDEKKLIDLGVKDSKLLTLVQRESMFDKIPQIVDKYKIIIISPKQVDEALNDETTNLNWLEADHSVIIINELNSDKAILDAPSNNIAKFTEYVEKRIKTKTKIIAEHKADLNYPVVSAASILAKVTRDREIEKIKKKIKINFGSGYPSDPRTQEFLKNNYNKYPEIFRKTWSSYKSIVEGKKQKKLFDFGSEDKTNPVLKNMKKLEKQGYKFMEPKSSYEQARMTGPSTIVLYNTGKLLIQGSSKEEKKFIEDTLKK